MLLIYKAIRLGRKALSLAVKDIDSADLNEIINNLILNNYLDFFTLPLTANRFVTETLRGIIYG